MLNRQVGINVKELDAQIGILTDELLTEEVTEKRDIIIKEIDQLSEIRCKLSESKGLGSVKPAVLSGLFGIASVLIVLKYEESDVIITSKAFNIATNLFRGR